MSRIPVYIQLIFLCILFFGIWGLLYLLAPRIEVSLIDIRLAPPDNKWVEGLVKKDMQQLEIVFEISNKYQREIKFFDVYSKKLNSLSLSRRSVGAHYRLAPKSKQECILYYLVEDKNIINKINPAQDLLAYSAFEPTISQDSGNWFANYILAPFFGVGFTKAIDARKK